MKHAKNRLEIYGATLLWRRPCFRAVENLSYGSLMSFAHRVVGEVRKHAASYWHVCLSRGLRIYVIYVLLGR